MPKYPEKNPDIPEKDTPPVMRHGLMPTGGVFVYADDC